LGHVGGSDEISRARMGVEEEARYAWYVFSRHSPHGNQALLSQQPPTPYPPSLSRRGIKDVSGCEYLFLIRQGDPGFSMG
jgi:hypothetical protein